LAAWFVSDAYAAPPLANVDPAALKSYVQVALFGLSALLVCIAFFWSLFATASNQPRVAALGTKVFGQVLTFMFGALTGFLAT
jgi:hypothetical protein